MSDENIRELEDEVFADPNDMESTKRLADALMEEE